ncbi:MAG: aminoacyltransferase, partial [Chloroflexi bacterium]|nr:aminoacyltransferase [Chloroflexota bacterium]
MPVITLAEWNEFLSRFPDTHFLQTGEWGELKKGFGWDPVRVVAGESGAQVLFRRLPLGFTVAYIPKGPVTGGQHSAPGDLPPEFWAEVDEVCRLRRAAFLKVEPDSWDDNSPPILHRQQSGIHYPPIVAGSHNIQPRRTILVDLTSSEKEILARMKQKCRYNIRLAGKKGVTVRPWDDLVGFHAMMTLTG